MGFLKSYFQKETVDEIVIGLPKTLKGEEDEWAKHIRSVGEHISKAYPNKPIHFLDERFTTSIALRSMIDSGMKKKDRRVKGNADKISATIILQDFLTAKK